MDREERLIKIHNYNYDGWGGNFVAFNKDKTVHIDGWFDLETLKLIVEELEEKDNELT
jgi:hypothetical protein